ncbi:GTP binding protein [Trichophyton equinum CBS 127.97]|uniref:GTP binding protein n=1 Tax=Trichophyton equinum (strain ATCC MYA-4606 / CBS 127.97) TaxID=559882 RepID=F2PLY6_TRIEC|nr:GTP binding protein [Trichophyton equinum CBS 127.97]
MGSSQRPLSELSPVAQKRNSPSWKDPASTESSPFENSPMSNATSPRRFWQGRDAGSPFRLGHENSDPYEGSPRTSSASKRSSIENLMRASRVKNSSMFAREHKQEFDPTHIQVLERPLAGGRPLSRQFQNSQDGTSQIDARRQLPSQTAGFRNSGEGAGTPQTATKSGDEDASSPIKSPTSQSPGKSSLSKASRFGRGSAAFDPRREIWSDDADESRVSMTSEGYSYHRQTKSVTFDAAPPQVNEYEMTTPVPSSVASSSREGSFEDASNEDSFDQSYSMEIEDSFDASLEDTDKTPVVLPDEWRYMSPDSANDETVGSDGDPFNDDFGSPGPDIRPSSRDSTLFKNRIESLDSNGERRPLPPLPPSQSSPQTSRSSPSPGLNTAFERGSSAQRDIPQPLRPASCSKSDIASPSRNSLSLEDRLKLMMSGEHSYQSDAETQRERRMRRAGAKERSVERDLDHSQKSEGNDESPAIESPRISRESILKNMKSREESSELSEYHDTSHNSGNYNSLPLDPDVPIPSLETDQPFEDETVIIKEEDDDDDMDIYSVPMFSENDTNGEADHTEATGHIVDDSSSRYSDTSKDDVPTPPGGTLHNFEMGSGELTPTKSVHSPQYPEHDLLASSMSGPDADPNFDVQFTSYIDQSTPPAEDRLAQPPRIDLENVRNSLDRPGSPDSVIRHPISPAESPDQSLIVPEPIATIKAPGGTYKTRTSLTPADVNTMAATRRRVSGQDVPVSPIEEFKPLPRVEQPVKEEESTQSEQSKERKPLELASLPEKSRISSLVKLDIKVDSGSDGFGLDAEFDRVMEAQKVAFDIPLSQLSAQTSGAGNPTQDASSSSVDRNTADTTTTKQRGYLMRQNTKMVVATSRPEDDANTESVTAPNSPRKASQQTWTTEPWTPKARRQSIKMSGAIPRKKIAEEPVPPLPGQESTVKDAPNGAEETVEADTGDGCDNTGEDGDRGRLFVKVVGAKDLDLPLPRGERSYFSLTLDNGLHCVTTSCLELGRSAPIGQEFELVVMQELEFQLTLQMKPDQIKPKPQPARPASPTKAPKPQKSSAFSRVFASPKKRREMELRQQQEAQQLQKRQAEEKALANIIDPWEKVRKIVDKDGNFARAYVSLADFEEKAFGRPLTVDVTCFNEWAIDETVSSVKSKRSTVTTVSRRPPYKIGTLELQLLYVPKPKGATDDDLPKSMNACIREMKEADHAAARSWEGFLSQQGGDCPYWRRRLFKLQGSKLTAFHEVTRQPRATINLAKAVKLIDDRSSLTQKETSAKGGRRRKSAFAEEEEGYMFVEEGFRIRFGNGEVIDFYADSRAEKDGWMKVLSETVGKCHSSGSGQAKPWTDLVLRREKNLNIKRPVEDKKPTVEEKKLVRHSYAPPPPPKEQHIGQTRPTPGAIPRPRHQPQLSQPNINSQEARRQKTRSLIF